MMVAAKQAGGRAPPGPGSYFPRTAATNNGSPAFTFGKRTPASSTQISSSRSTNNMISSSSSSISSSSCTTPGPAQYFPSAQHNTHSPAFSMGKRAPPAPDAATPGPGSYFVLTHPLSNSHSPAFTLASRPPLASSSSAAAAASRKFVDAAADSGPGPGSYDTSSSSIGGPKFTIRTRTPVFFKEPLPGPGSYFVDHSQASSPSPLYHHHRPQPL